MENFNLPSIIQIYKKFFQKLIWAGLALILIIGLGFIGFILIHGENSSILEPLIAATIMVVKTSLNEIPLFNISTSGKVLAICLSFMGLVMVSFITSVITAFIVEGTLKETFWRKKMEKRISKLKNHYIVCGVEEAGYYIVKELHETQRPYILVDTDRKIIERIFQTIEDQIFIEGDPTDGNTLSKAGIQDAKGIFAVAQEDNQNLVICLTAKHLNPSIKVVARCSEIKNIEKLKKAGADAVVSPSYIGGLRMASEMIRPTVVSFLDIMLRDKDKNLRVEEVPIPEAFIGKPISSLHLKKYSQILLLAINAKDSWIYNPPDDYVIKPQNTLIFITTPQERYEIERIFQEQGGE